MKLSGPSGAAETAEQTVLRWTNLPTFTAGAAACLFGISACAWAVASTARLGMMPIGMICSGDTANSTLPTQLLVTHLTAMLLMSAVMSIAMMTPVGAPAILAQLRTLRSSALPRRLSFFALSTAGYFTIWLLAAVPFTLAQWGLEAWQPNFTMGGANPSLVLGLLVGAGCYQLTPWKRACLNRCTTEARSASATGGFRPMSWGLAYGLNCVGSCWALMALMFVAGMSNIAWSAALCVLMIAERMLPSRRRAALGPSSVAATASDPVVACVPGWVRRRNQF